MYMRFFWAELVRNVLLRSFITSYPCYVYDGVMFRPPLWFPPKMRLLGVWRLSLIFGRNSLRIMLCRCCHCVLVNILMGAWYWIFASHIAICAFHASFGLRLDNFRDLENWRASVHLCSYSWVRSPDGLDSMPKYLDDWFVGVLQIIPASDWISIGTSAILGIPHFQIHFHEYFFAA